MRESMRAAASWLPFRSFCVAAVLWMSCCGANGEDRQPPAGRPYNRGVRAGDWPQLGGTPHRNNTPEGRNVPTDWDVKTGRNIKWSVPLGSQSYGNVVVANGQVYVGTNN
ncbi:MAG TPA: PQQ-binding-like beta-propeller repeat protein, partial [Planctomycetaceae bacterium]